MKLTALQNDYLVNLLFLSFGRYPKKRNISHKATNKERVHEILKQYIYIWLYNGEKQRVGVMTSLFESSCLACLIVRKKNVIFEILRQNLTGQACFCKKKNLKFDLILHDLDFSSGHIKKMNAATEFLVPKD